MSRLLRRRPLRRRPCRARARGVALLMVMWLVMLLAALVGAFALTARIEHMQGRTLEGELVAGQTARAGLEYALTRVADDDPAVQWKPDGRPYAWTFNGAQVLVHIVDESGKVDLNTADTALLGRLLLGLGVPRAQADAVAAAIVDWRDADSLTQPQGGAEDPDYEAAGLPYGAKDAPFDTVAEVEQVLGMTPQIYAKAQPFLTVYSGQASPDPNFAAPEVLQAMGVDAAPIIARRGSPGRRDVRDDIPVGDEATLVGAGSGTYSVDSRARLQDGRQAVLRAVVRAGVGTVPGTAYTALRWEEGATPR